MSRKLRNKPYTPIVVHKPQPTVSTVRAKRMAEIRPATVPSVGPKGREAFDRNAATYHYRAAYKRGTRPAFVPSTGNIPVRSN